MKALLHLFITLLNKNCNTIVLEILAIKNIHVLIFRVK